MRVHVLTPGFTTSNGSAFLFPLVVHKNVIKESSIDLRILNRNDHRLAECDILAIDSKEFRTEWAKNSESIQHLINSYRSSGAKILWFDTTDSTGTLQADAFPVVDKYLKSQLLTDTNRYTDGIYGGRAHSEYYNKANGITDDDTAVNQPIKPEDVLKLGVSWNSGLANYSTYGPLKMGLFRRTKISKLLKYPSVGRIAGSDRPIDISARFGASHNKATVRYQREQVRKLLSERMDTNKLNRRGYISELKQAKVVLSPFGWGEITLKDFEVFLTGGMLLKPSMTHMRTWPIFFEDNKTFLSFRWDLSDLESQIENALDNPSERLEIASEGQSLYSKHTSGPEAAELFVNHLNGLLTQ